MFKKILLIAFILRIIIVPFYHHDDTYDQLNWAKDLENRSLVGFYQRDIPDAGPPNYPPVYFLTIYAHNKTYLLLKNILWSLNTSFEIFPSKIYLWFESDLGRIAFNKILPIIGDLGVGYIIYLFCKKLKNQTLATKALLLYLFLPPSWYISSIWGQTDSIYLFPLLASIYFLIIKKNNFLSLILFTISFLIKPLAILILPIFLIYLIKLPLLKSIKGIIFSFLLFIMVHFPFGLKITEIPNFYIYTVREISGYISSNAFNFWGVLYSFGPIKDSANLLGIPVFYWGLIITFVIMTYIIGLAVNKSENTIKIIKLTLFSYTSFLFLTRMHERYFYLTYILFILSYILFKKIKWFFYLSCFVFTINLYHYWWVPGGDLFKYFLSNRLVETIFCLVNLLVFFYLIRYGKRLIKDNSSRTNSERF